MNSSWFLFVVQIVLSIGLVILVLVQTKGGIGGLFGGEGSVARRRRGVEKTLFQITIGFSVVFFVNAFVLALQSWTVSVVWTLVLVGVAVVVFGFGLWSLARRWIRVH